MVLKNQKKKKINLYLANPRGFCAGVDRAIKMVEESLKVFGKPVYVRHEIVHNRYVVEKLKKLGAIFVDELNEIPNNNHPVIFSAHGVPKSVPLEAKKKNLNFFDATCPLVSKIHREVEFFSKKKFEIILIGHRNHPEVIGTMGQINNSKIYLVENISDAKKLKILNQNNLAYVTQTTLSVDDTAEIIKILKKRFPKIKEPKKDDICYATTNRQEAVKKLAKICEYIIIIGAYNSSNSLRLVEVAKKNGCKNSILIESHKKFNWNSIKNNSSIGLSASASAPEELIDNFVAELKKKFITNIVEDSSIKENVIFNIPNYLKKVS
tara:strand:+ start:3877 stop:4845 length:969 start_codon:yes stop_codon:yes gene_type:complete